MELESLNHGVVDSDAVVRADSLVNLACFDGGAAVERVCDGTIRFGLLRLGRGSCENVARLGDGWSEKYSEVKASSSAAGLHKLCSV